MRCLSVSDSHLNVHAAKRPREHFSKTTTPKRYIVGAVRFGSYRAPTNIPTSYPRIQEGQQMLKYRIIAKDDLLMYPHTWTKGEDYEIVEHPGRISLASNEGQTNFFPHKKAALAELFDGIKVTGGDGV